MKRNITFIIFLFLAFSLHAQLPTGFNPVIADYEEVIPEHGPGNVTTPWYHSKGSSPDSIKIVENPLKDEDNPSDSVILWKKPQGDWKLMDYWYAADPTGLVFDESFTSIEFKIRADSLDKVYFKISGTVDGQNQTLVEKYWGYIPNDTAKWQHYELEFDQQEIQGLGNEVKIIKIQIFPNPQNGYQEAMDVYIDDVKFNVALSGVDLDITSKTINVGDTFRLTPIFDPDYATNKSVTWLCSDTTVAAVDSTGMVSGVTEGEAIIRVKTDDGSYTADCNVTVETTGTALSGVALDITSKTINVGDTFQLTPIFEPDDATNKSVTWLSSDTTIATVDSTGLVSGVAEGEAIITVQTDDGGYTADCNVTVGTGTNVAEINSNIFKVYPNPSTDGFIFVELKQSYNSPVQMSVYDLTGNNLINVTQNTGKRIQLNHNLKPGMYFMKININDKTNTIKYLVK